MYDYKMVNWILKDNLAIAQARIKNYVDKKRFERQFKVRDFVLLTLQP